MYLDANNLYGWAMKQLLSVGGFQWVNPELDEVLTTPDDAPEGYVLEVEANAKVRKRLDEFINLGSGWRLNRCETLDLGIVQYRPFCGRSYIKTPVHEQLSSSQGQQPTMSGI